MKEQAEYKKKVNPRSLANLTARGRPKGCRNKTTNLKQAVLDTFDRLGGSSGLYKWVNEKPKHKEIFYGTLFAKMLPKHVDLDSTKLDDIATRLLEARKMQQGLIYEKIIEGKVLEVSNQGVVKVLEEIVEEDDTDEE